MGLWVVGVICHDKLSLQVNRVKLGHHYHTTLFRGENDWRWGCVCVWVSRYGVILYARQSERDTPTTFREKTDRTEKEGGEGDKILRGVADAASPTRQMFR